MAAISAGEFERIFKELYKPLCLFALRFTEKTEDAEDVVQQALPMFGIKTAIMW